MRHSSAGAGSPVLARMPEGKKWRRGPRSRAAEASAPRATRARRLGTSTRARLPGAPPGSLVTRPMLRTLGNGACRLRSGSEWPGRPAPAEAPGEGPQRPPLTTATDGEGEGGTQPAGIRLRPCTGRCRGGARLPRSAGGRAVSARTQKATPEPPWPEVGTKCLSGRFWERRGAMCGWTAQARCEKPRRQFWQHFLWSSRPRTCS